ncbi:GNAT family N-acetyltransferase [Vibrio kyushuensis]|uniref:GNAT family N-acetyltransferase n=1 Tax=Vibrio kyushuensis TaxID=2910249 RepID=UPI003D12A815
MYLKRFSNSFADEICHWFPTHKESLLWGGGVFSWPLQPSDLVERSQHQNLEFYALVDNENVLGFIELQKTNETEIRLCRVAISPQYRGKGIGKKLVQLSLNEIKQRNTYTLVTLAVFAENLAAYNCYQSLGFYTVDKDPKYKQFNGETWPLFQMEIAL